MLNELVNALKKFNSHAGHNCKIVISDFGIISLHQHTIYQNGKTEIDILNENFCNLNDCIEWLTNN